MSDYPPLVRQWILLRLLGTHRFGLSVKDLADESKVGSKTVRRDLETFREAGFPLQETTLEHGRKVWRIDPDKSHPGLDFAYDEALALYIGRRFLEPLAGTPFWVAAQGAFRKLRAVLGDKALQYVERVAPAFHQTTVGAGDYSQKADIIDALMVGIEDRKSVFITYQSLRATEAVTYDVYPYGMVYHRGALYLVGRKAQVEEICHWKVSRIEAAEVTQMPFQRPKDFDLRQHLAGSFGIFQGDDPVHVKVRFAPPVARYVEESTWHPSQMLVRCPDGSLQAEFDLTATQELRAWLLSFGRHALVEEPQELRQEIAVEAAAMATAYAPAVAEDADDQDTKLSVNPPVGGAKPATRPKCNAPAPRISRRGSSSPSSSEIRPGKEAR